MINLVLRPSKPLKGQSCYFSITNVKPNNFVSTKELSVSVGVNEKTLEGQILSRPNKFISATQFF